MSTHAAVAPRASFRSGFDGTGFLLGFLLRRDKFRLTVITAAISMFCVYYLGAVALLYPSEAARQNRALSIANPGGVILSGPGYGLDNYSVGAMFANEMSLWAIAFLTMMNVFQITRNLRAEEETGRAELVAALPVGRYATSVAALLQVVIADLAFAVVGGSLLVVFGDLSIVDTFSLMIGMVATALVFAAVATLTCQLTVHARGASGLAFAVFAVAVAVRGVGDVQRVHGSWLSWLSPIAWAQQTRAYVDLRLWPIALSVVAIVVVLGIAAVFSARRDLGEGLLPERLGRADAPPSLAGPFALAFRQLRTTLLWWLVGCLVMFGLSGAFLGRGAAEIATSMAKQGAVANMIFGVDPLGAFVRIVFLHCALVVAGFAVAAVLRVKPEEEEGRLGLELSRPVSRTDLLLARLAVVTASMLVLLVVGGAVALWVGSLSTGGDVGLDILLPSAGAFALAIAVLITFTAAVWAWIPRATPLAWVLFAVVVVGSFFGPLMGLPNVINGISPFWWVGDYPITPLDPTHLIGLGVVAAALLGLAVTGFRRRDLTAG